MTPLTQGALRIAVITAFLPGESKCGVGYQAHGLANAMSDLGCAVTVFSNCQKPADARYAYRWVRPTRRLPVLTFAWRLRGLRGELSRFDVVHAHSDDWALGGLRGPVHVRTMHGSCFVEAWNTKGLKNRLRMLVLALGETAATAVADTTVAVSANTVRQYPWIKRVIPNGVDCSRFGPVGNAGGERSRVPSILFVGTYHHRKRGRLLMEAFLRDVRPRVPHAELWMVCSDAPEVEGVRVFGRVGDAELAELYRRAWVFCLPSRYEGFGVPYIEAMASGTPVVATPNVGAVEVLSGGEAGRLVEPAELGGTLAELLQDEKQRMALSQAGLRRAQDFTLTSVVDRYLELYRALCESRSNTKPSSVKVEMA